MGCNGDRRDRDERQIGEWAGEYAVRMRGQAKTRSNVPARTSTRNDSSPLSVGGGISGGAVIGAGIGAAVGGPPGAVVGGVIGAVVGVIAAVGSKK